MKNKLWRVQFRLISRIILINISCVLIALFFHVLRRYLMFSFYASFPNLTQSWFFIKLESLNNFLTRTWIIEEFAIYLISLVLLTRPFANYLLNIQSSMEQISSGQLDSRLPIRFNNELTAIANRVNELVAKTESKIKETVELERSKNELLVNVSHDLRTPLTSILGYLDLIHRGQYKDEAGLLYYTEIINQKAHRLNRLIDDLFAYVVTRDPKIKLRLQTLNLKELLKQLMADFDLQLKQNGMHMRCSFPEESVYVQGEGDKLARAFENLLSNAIRYSDPESHIELIVTRGMDVVTIQVINYGLPIPEYDLPYIFDRFYRVEKSRSEETGGTGLGLSIVKNIIDLHGGTITVESNDERTCFEVTLPVKK